MNNGIMWLTSRLVGRIRWHRAARLTNYTRGLAGRRRSALGARCIGRASHPAGGDADAVLLMDYGMDLDLAITSHASMLAKVRW